MVGEGPCSEEGHQCWDQCPFRQYREPWNSRPSSERCRCKAPPLLSLPALPLCLCQDSILASPSLSLQLSPSRASLYTDSEMEEKDKQWKTLVPLFICNASLFKRLPSLLRLLFLPLICAAYDVRCFFSDAPESYCISILAPPVHVFVLSEFGSCILLGPRGFGNL